MATTHKVRQIVQVFPLGGERFREDPLVAPAQDAVAWEFAEVIAEKHVAGWLFLLAGKPVPGFELATSVRIEGLARHKPHPNGSFVWQTQGSALVIATRLDIPQLEHRLSDYRTAEGRVDRARSASSDRARMICEAMEAGVPPGKAIAAYRLPSVRRDAVTETALPPPGSSDAEKLDYYRSLIIRERSDMEVA